MLTDEQKERRKHSIGGSDSPVICGISPFMTPRDLWLEKKGLLPERPETPAMKRGTRMESVAAEMFMEKTGIELVTVDQQLIHPDLPWWSGHVDRTTTDGETVAEIKVPGWRQFSKIRREGMSDYIQVQNQHYMLYPKFKRGIYIIMSLEEWDVLWFEQEPDAELQGAIVEADSLFWEMLQRDVEPPEVSSPVIDLPPIGNSEILRISSPEWYKAISELQEAQEILEEAEALKEAAKAEILRQMANHEVAESEGFRAYNKLQNGRTSIDTKRLKKEMPDIYSKYAKTGVPFKSFRTFFLKGSHNDG
jgi:putative phage-type endonuclease